MLPDRVSELGARFQVDIKCVYVGTIHVVPEVETLHSLGGDGSTDDAGCVVQFSGI